MSNPTPGQVAYEAYWQTWLAGLHPQLPWERLIPDNKCAWEAAAEAVRAMQPPPHVLYRYRLGQQVRWTCEPDAVWRITYRASHEDRQEGLRLYYGIRDEDSRLLRMAEESDLRSTEAPHA